MIRCRADWTELDEKPTGYFLNKGKQIKITELYIALFCRMDQK